MDGWFAETWAGSGSKGWKSKGNKGLSSMEPKEQRKLVTLNQGEARTMEAWPPWILKWILKLFPKRQC